MNTTATAPTQTRTISLLLQPLIYWHLLSLDAPTVAVLWTFFIASCASVGLSFSSVAAMFLAVWILYAADRLLDSRLLYAHPLDGRLEARHLFHYKHRRLFRAAIFFCSALLGPLLLNIPPEAIHLYLLVGGLLFGWFILIHVASERESERLPKELAVGIFFAAATFIPTVSRLPQLQPRLLPHALLFAILCSLNCLLIYAWEHPLPERSLCAHPITRLALKHLRSIAVVLVLSSSLLALIEHNHLSDLPIAIALSASTLLLLDVYRPSSPIVLRAAADLSLLAPVIFLIAGALKHR